MGSLPTPSEEIGLLREAVGGNTGRLQEVMAQHRDRLRKMISFRLDRRLWGRLDPSDVIQDVFLVASNRLSDYLADPCMPFFLWLRFLTCQELVTLHRRHLGATMRDANRDVSLHDVAMDSSSAIAAKLAADQISPSEAALREEMADQMRAALDQMEALDREVLALRHFEGLSNGETATVLNLSISAASKRYIRAAERLRAILMGMPSPPTPPGGLPT